MSEPDSIGIDAVVPPRRSVRARLGSRLRLGLARIRARGRLQVGRGVHAGPRVAIRVATGARVTIGDGCVLRDGARIEAQPRGADSFGRGGRRRERPIGGEVRLGSRTLLGPNAIVRARAGVTIGAGCLIGDSASIDDAGPTFADVERPIHEQPLRSLPIAIGDGARIGPHAAVLPGATLPAGAVVGAYAAVGGDAPDHGASSGAGVA